MKPPKRSCRDIAEFKELAVSTCVEATKCKYALNLVAIEVDISPTASVADDENEERVRHS